MLPDKDYAGNDRGAVCVSASCYYAMLYLPEAPSHEGAGVSVRNAQTGDSMATVSERLSLCEEHS